MESVLWTNTPHGNYKGCGTISSVFAEKQNTSWTPHFGLEYQYRINRWLGVGLMTDYQRTQWNEVLYNNENEEVARSRQHFYNLSFIPTVRFTYLNTKLVNLYSALSVGITINGGTEKDEAGRNTVVSPAFELSLIGATINKGPWFLGLELGGLYSLKGSNNIYMVNSKLLTLSFGYRL